MDKATFHAEVISQVKELKKNAMEARKGFLIPTEADEVKVEPYDIDLGHGCMFSMATICLKIHMQMTQKGSIEMKKKKRR
jgi:hypothetical protein